MTLIQMKRRIESLEKQLSEVQRTIEYQQAVEGIRRGLESMNAGAGKPAKSVLSEIRRIHQIPVR
jgi:hypothetical protein